MKLMLWAFGLVAALLVATPSAHADVLIEALGSAPVGAANADAARQRATDEAFRQAVDQVIAQLVAPAARQANAQSIKTRILRRARTYVVKFKILDEGEAEGVYQFRIEATVASAVLANDLRAIGVPLLGAAEPPGPNTRPEPNVDAPIPVARPRIALLGLTRLASGEVLSTFGSQGGEGGPVVAAIADDLRTRGFELAPTAQKSAPVAPAAGPEASSAPLDDAQAAALARAAGAGAALVVIVDAKDGGRIRGTRFVGADLEISVRALELGGAESPVRLAETKVRDAGFGADVTAALVAAARTAVPRVEGTIGTRLVERWPDSRPAGNGVAVRIRGLDTWRFAGDLSAALSSTPGVQSVSVIRLARGQITLLVRGNLRTQAVVDLAAAAPTTGPRPVVRIAGERVIDVQQPAVDGSGDGYR